MHSRRGRRTFFDNLSESWKSGARLEKLGENCRLLELSAGDICLDMGCGHGVCSAILAEMVSPGGRVISVDYSMKMLLAGRENGLCDFGTPLCGACESLPLRDSSIDAAVAFQCLPHFSDKKTAVDELFRVLRPGARAMVLHFDSSDGINRMHRRIKGPVSRDHLPKAGELANLSSSIGFRVVEALERDDLYRVLIKKPPAEKFLARTPLKS